MTQNERDQESGHISIVYFHGMGNQRRYEEVSRLVDGIDSYLESSHSRGASIGKLRRIRARAEVGIQPEDKDVTFVRAVHLGKDNNDKTNARKAQFYEAYWADEMREERFVRGVVLWILRQIRRPVTML